MTKASRSPARSAASSAGHTPSVAPSSLDLTATEAAWHRHEARIRAMAPSEVNDAKIDITVAAAIATAGARNLLTRREALTAEFRAAPFDVFERVADVALAAQHADVLSRAPSDPTGPFADILPRITELRGLMLDDLAVQVRRKRVPAKVVDGIRAGDNTVRDKANDLNDLAVYYRSNWSRLSDKTTVEADEVAEASRLALVALTRLGGQIVTPTAEDDQALTPVDLRRRAFTALLQDYDVVQRFGSFAFWGAPGGWEQFVPSLWSGRAQPGTPSAEPAPVPAPEPAAVPPTTPR